MGRGKGTEPPRLDTGAGVQLQAVSRSRGSRRSIQGLGLPAMAGPERRAPGGGTCWALRSGSLPPSRASPCRNSCTSTRPSLLLSSSSKRRPQRCRRSASPGPPRMAFARGGRGGPGAAALAGASQLPLPPGAPQGQLRGHGRRRLCAVGLAPALAGGGNCSPSPPAPKLAFPLPRRGLGAELVEAGWGECQGCPGIAHPREHLGSFWEEGLERSMVSVLVPEFCL